MTLIRESGIQGNRAERQSGPAATGARNKVEFFAGAQTPPTLHPAMRRPENPGEGASDEPDPAAATSESVKKSGRSAVNISAALRNQGGTFGLRAATARPAGFRHQLKCQPFH